MVAFLQMRKVLSNLVSCQPREILCAPHNGKHSELKHSDGTPNMSDFEMLSIDDELYSKS